MTCPKCADRGTIHGIDFQCACDCGLPEQEYNVGDKVYFAKGILKGDFRWNWHIEEARITGVGCEGTAKVGFERYIYSVDISSVWYGADDFFRTRKDAERHIEDFGK